MKLTRLLLAPILALIPAALCAQDDVASSVSETESVDLATALERGKTIYRYDQAAWHTTDVLLEEVPDPAGAGIRGWVVVEDGDALKVTYWKSDGDTYSGVFSANYDGSEVSGRVVHSDADQALNDEQVALIEASQVPDPANMQKCGDQRWNRVVMPSGKANGSTLVYFLTPQVERGYPMGGHYRYEVLDGEVLDLRGFARVCDLLLAKNAETGERLEGHMVTHILDPVPTEIHVFTVFSSRIPLYVGTLQPQRMWALGIRDGEPTADLVN